MHKFHLASNAFGTPFQWTAGCFSVSNQDKHHDQASAKVYWPLAPQLILRLFLATAGLTVTGVPLTLLDTAGIRTSNDTVEKLGVERSTAAAAAADLVLMVIDAATGWTDADGDIFESLWGKEGPGGRKCLVQGLALLVVNKSDLAGKLHFRSLQPYTLRVG